MIPVEDRIEALFCGALPGESQRDFGTEYLGLACAGLDHLSWAALRYRLLGDHSASTVLYPAIAGIALSNPYAAVRNRADLLARLVLAEESNPALVAKLSVETIAEGFLLASRSLYYKKLHSPHLALRARLDTWARSGIGHIARRLR